MFGLLLASAGFARAENPEFVLPLLSEMTPSGDERRFWQIQRVVFSGNSAIPTADLNAVAVSYLNRALGAADIEALRQALTRLYIDRGYVNSGVQLASNPIQDGALHFQVTEGQVERVNVRGLQHLPEAYLTRRLVLPDETFNLNVLQDRVRLLLADPLIGKLNVQVRPGSRPGLAELDVDALEGPRYRLTAFANNHQSAATGEFAAGIQGEWFDPTGLGDRISLTLQGNDAQHGVNLDWQWPVGDGILHAGYNTSESAVVEAPIDRLDIDSESSAWEIGVSYPLLNRFNQHFRVGLDYSRRSSRTRLLGMPFAFSPGAPDGHNVVDDWRFHQEYMQRDNRLAFALRSTFTFGQNNAPTLPGSSGMLPDAYWLWVGQAHLAYPFSRHGQLLTRATLQYTDDRLVSLEQLSIGGASTVRGYRENQLVRDTGWLFSLEYRHQLQAQAGRPYRIALYPLLDIGSGRNVGQSGQRLASFGVGASVTSKSLEADLVLAKQLEKSAAGSGTLQDRGVHVQVRYRF